MAKKMATIGRFELDAATANDSAAVAELVRATVIEGEELIRFSGCDYDMVQEIVFRLRKQGLPVAGLQYEDYPPEYFVNGCKSV